MSKKSSFARYLRRLQRRHSDSVQAFATQLAIDPTHLSRAMGANGRPFDIPRLFQLAELTAENPSDVLRAAGKDELATLIESFYGRPRKQTPQSLRLQEVIKLWEAIEASRADEEGLDIVLTLLRRSRNYVMHRTAKGGTRRERTIA